MSSRAIVKEASSRPSVVSLLIASASSVASALLVSRLWGPGTLLGAAAAPVLFILVGELLRPVERLGGVRTPAPLVRGGPEPSPGEMAEPTIYRARRRPVAVALAAGLAAFVAGALALTGAELVGGSALGSGDERTTIFQGEEHPSAPRTPGEPGGLRTTPTPAAPQTTAPPVGAAPITPPTTTAPAPPSGATPPSVAIPDTIPPPAGTTPP